jgi:Xaa-Pro aminopeptidase
VDSSTLNYSVYSSIKSEKNEIILDKSPILLLKAIKNQIEIEGFRNSHIRDGVALTKFLFWLESEFEKKELNEIDVSNKLLEFRKKQDLFFSESFDTISAFGPNASIIHYKPTSKTCLKIDNSNFFLLDSGAQYLDGTTDVTRTIHLGSPTDYQKECFTMVLKGIPPLTKETFHCHQ